ncbi:MAG: SGNH/GDSL hydrolase family protein [Chitinophagaceae bacterium]
MENKSRIYSFFIVVALFFWNPLSYYLLYRKMPVYPLSMVKLAYWLVFLIGLWCIYLINKININEKIKNIFFASSVTGILFGILALVNFFFSPPVKQKISAVVQKSTGLIFEPGVNAHYKTVEFDYIATINKLGLRNKEVQIDKKNNYRVLCFGDSWTFGWGVKDESTWPSKLQKYFQEKGYKEVEIINCGQGGQYTTVYKNYMEKIIPLLRPDLVLVGVLQLDDLAQLFENKQLLILTKPAPAIKKTSWYSKIMESFSVYMNNSVGNIVALLKSKTPSKTLQVQTSWEEAAVNKIASLTPENKIKFATLSDTFNPFLKAEI